MMSLQRSVQFVPESMYLSILNELVSYKISNITLEGRDSLMVSAGGCLLHIFVVFLKWSRSLKRTASKLLTPINL